MDNILIAYESSSKKEETAVLPADYASLLERAVQAEARAEVIAGQCAALRIRVAELDVDLAATQKEASATWAAGERAVREAREERDRAKSDVVAQTAAIKRLREALEVIADGNMGQVVCYARRVLEKP
jgi:chromosome segregation ATPase